MIIPLKKGGEGWQPCYAIKPGGIGTRERRLSRTEEWKNGAGVEGVTPPPASRRGHRKYHGEG
jgi:hypothetical protein